MNSFRLVSDGGEVAMPSFMIIVKIIYRFLMYVLKFL